MYYIPRKKNFRISPPVCFCLASSWSMILADRTEAGYSAIFLDFWVAHQTWDWFLHTCSTCLWSSQQFPGSGAINNFKLANVTMLHHSWKTHDDLWARLNRNPVFASLFGIVDILESISQDIHKHRYGGTGKMAERGQGGAGTGRLCI